MFYYVDNADIVFAPISVDMKTGVDDNNQDVKVIMVMMMIMITTFPLFLFTGEVNGEAMFIFNLSSIATTERVLRAHVHLYKRKSTPRKRRSRMRADTELVLYEVAPHYLSQTGSIIMRSSARGWQWYGATDAVLSCLLVDREHPHLFALSFRAEKPNGKIRTLALKKFVRHHSLPFLILYSNETESVNLEELDIVAERLKQREEDSELRARIRDDDFEEGKDDEDVEDDRGDVRSELFEGDEEEDEEDRIDEVGDVSQERAIDAFHGFGRKRRHRKLNKAGRKKKHGHHKTHNSNNNNNNNNSDNKSKEDDVIENVTDADQSTQTSDSADSTVTLYTKSQSDSGRAMHEDSASLPLSSSRRKKRSILTNEIPEDPVDYPQFPYRFNLPQTHPGMLTARKEARHRLEKSRIIPYPAERSSSKSKSQRRRRKHRKRKNRRRNRKNRRRILLPEEWEDYHDNLATPDNNPGQVCSRRRLVVDFADIGWGDWIISPKSFEAHYCSGTCPFPLTKVSE